MAYKLNFKESENIIKNYSQASQDIFVLSCLNGKRKGTFLDLGCHDPIDINNTYLLENSFDWKGVSYDIDSHMIERYKENRKNLAFVKDCTKIDFEEVLSFYDSNHIDYLSLDLEPASVTYDCLKRIPFEKIEFSIITFEHDFYRFGDEIRTNSREIFQKYGYYLLCSNVSDGTNIYEDWYINPKYVDLSRVSVLESESLSWQKILYG